jgi:hypothetical protein
MDTFLISDLTRLMQSNHGPCVTIMMPTHVGGPDQQQDALRLGNLADLAQESLSNGWLRPGQAREWLAPVRESVSDVDFWENRSLGLAFFLQSGSLQRFRLPMPLEELALVNHRFYVKPLIRLASENQRFFVLAVSQHQVSLYEATEFKIEKVDVTDLPQRLEETLNIEGADRGQQQHLANQWGKGKQASVFHGHGGAKETHKSELTLFFNQIDQILSPILGHQQLPIVLAGVDYLLPIFRKALSYPHVVDAEIHGNWDHSTMSHLHQKAWPLVHPWLLRAQILATQKFQDLSKTDLATSGPQTAIKAAFDGRVDTMFVDINTHLWGKCDQQGQVCASHDELQSGDDDLLDSAAAETLLHGGKVHAVPADQMPCSGPVAALLRY